MERFFKVYKIFLDMAYTNKIKNRKPTKTISGVTPLAVMVKPRKCDHGTCLYCPSIDTPQSYVPDSPVVLRAAALKYDSYKQVKARLKAFKVMGHPTDKVELIIMGGTFLSYPLGYQNKFITGCYNAFNNSKVDLEKSKKLNEKAKHRCVALCIETRPDVCGKEEINRMLNFGATRCEIGVQIPDDRIYKKIKRGHTVKDVLEATRLLKDFGFKTGYHMMVNLPGSNVKHDFEMFKKIFEDSDFKPDQIKIYPTQVIKGAKLVKLYEGGKYKTYSEKELIELILKIKRIVPEHCRIMRVMREIPFSYLVSGTKRIDLRNILFNELVKRKIECKCIRCREVGFRLLRGEKVKKDVKTKRKEYEASKGKEIFISAENSDKILFGICRLRIPSQILRKEFTGKTILLRELHVYGPQVDIGKLEKKKWQHKGIGRKLMEEAGEVAKEEGCNKIAVISGVGVRDYYRSLGYKLEGAYMVKKI